MSLLDGYTPDKEEENNSLLAGYTPETQTEHKSLLDGYVADAKPQKKDNVSANIEPVIISDEQPTQTAPQVVTGGVSKDVRLYNDRFPDRSKNFFGNVWSDTKDTVSGLAGILGNTVNFGLLRPATDLIRGEGFFTGKGREDLKNLKEGLPAFVEGLKENYGQKDIDMVNWERLKEGKSPIQIDLEGLGQSYYAHPFNLLDFVGVGEIGKASKVKNFLKTKGGELSDFSKTVGNKTVSPKYSENLVLNAGQRILETAPVQNIVNAIDNSRLRQLTDAGADFLGLAPESRLMGTKGAEVRKAKLIEQANQTKNITERNKAIAENQAKLSGLSESEAKALIESIETGATDFTRTDVPSLKELKSNISKQKYEKGKLETRKGRRNNRFYNQTLPTLINDVEFGSRQFNNIIKDIYKNPQKVRDAKYFDEIVNKVENLFPPEEYLPGQLSDAYDRLFKAIDSADAYVDVKNKNTAAFIENRPKEPLTEKMQEIRQAMKEKAQQNAEAYKEMGKLTDETIEQLPINTYAAKKYNKDIVDLTPEEKLDAFKDIQKMPDSQKPFYVPIMYDDNLRASDFFANTTKNYNPNELKQRKSGIKEVNSRGGKRIYDPVELANRLDAHRIKLINTENMIKEITDNFAKPLDLSKEQVLDGYVPFNPDSFLKFYRGAIDLNNLTIRKLQELDNIDTALKSALKESIKELPKDTVEYMGVMKNNKIYQIPKEVADTLAFGKNKKEIWEMVLDMSTAGFKRKVLGTSPKWFINNRIGNGIMAALKGVMPQDYIRALKIKDELMPEALRTKSMYEAEKTIIGRTGGGNNSTFGNTMRLLGGEFIDTKDLKGLDKIKVQAANTLGVPGKVINLITDAMFGFNQRFENWERKAAYVNKSNTLGRKMIKTTGQNIAKQESLFKSYFTNSNLENVKNNPEVLNAVLKEVDNTLGDYINMTSTERRILRKLVPFYSWYRTITRYTLSLPESNPFRANIANKIAMVNADKDKNKSEYQRGSVRTELTSDLTGKPLVLNYAHSVPFSTFEETVNNPIGFINPYIPKLFEAASGKRFFMDRLFESPNYETVKYPSKGYLNLSPEKYGEFSYELPTGESLKAFPIDVLRTSIPLEEGVERVVVGGLSNLINNGEFKPYDALYDTSLGGYNYNEGFSKKPKGWSVPEQALRYFLPVQQESKNVNKKYRPKRKPKN